MAEPKDSESRKKLSEIKKLQKKIDLAIIQTPAESPIQEVICKEDHKKLFEDLFKWK